MFFFLIDATVSYAKKNNYSLNKEDNSIRAIYISYLEYYNNFFGGSKTINQVKIDKMIDNVKERNYNTIILHVSPFSDSIYHSKIFPYSKTLTGKEGTYPGFDYLDYFLTKSHLKGIKVFAWINPYRISFDNNINEISKDNPAYKLINTSSILINNKGIYYNPASEIVKKLIVKQVEEIINNYNVDGIHFDDYFYMQDDIDKMEYNTYKENGGKDSLKEFRLFNTNDLIKRVYELIKKKNSDILFSISPDGNINNNYLYHYADVKTWLDSSDYVDIIMPQVYYGFNNEYSPFIKTLNEWMKLRKNNKISMVPVLAYYKIGEVDNEAGTGKNEWVEDNDIINRQIKVIKEYNLNGYGIFRYDYVVNDK